VERALAASPAGGRQLRRGHRIHAQAETARRAVILVTDEGENAAPFSFHASEISDELHVAPNVCIVRVPGAGAILEAECKRQASPSTPPV